ncbi:MAG: hypothetical protein WCD70_13345 [Alphaproteobacteria bacterium]
MSQQQQKPSARIDHHKMAADYSQKAVAEHTNAAKHREQGNHQKADQHAKNGHDNSAQALEHSRKALQPENRDERAA